MTYDIWIAQFVTFLFKYPHQIKLTNTLKTHKLKNNLKITKLINFYFLNKPEKLTYSMTCCNVHYI